MEMDGRSQTTRNGPGAIRPKRNAGATPSIASMKTLKLEQGAFNQELLQIIGATKVGWHSEDHERLVAALLARLIDENSEEPELNEEDMDAVKVLLRPTEERQRKVLKKTFERAGYQLDATTASAFELLFNVVQFGDYLSKKENPKTKKPFITKPAARGGKKKTFDALLAEEPVTEPVEEPQPEETSGDKDEPAPVQPKPENNKKSASSK
jgi:hypothetical protein